MFTYSNKINVIFDYKKEKSYEDRLSESTRIIDKYPGKIPIIVSKSNKCELNNNDKK